jgi:hypothetical protein
MFCYNFVSDCYYKLLQTDTPPTLKFGFRYQRDFRDNKDFKDMINNKNRSKTEFSSVTIIANRYIATKLNFKVR